MSMDRMDKHFPVSYNIEERRNRTSLLREVRKLHFQMEISTITYILKNILCSFDKKFPEIVLDKRLKHKFDFS
jgi:hypothetical protein